MPPNALAPAPPRLIENGAPRFGAYRGVPGDSSFASLGDEYRHPPGNLFVEKKWVYALVGDARVFAACAVVDLGFLSSGFFAIFDREQRKLLADHSSVLPPLFSNVGDQPGAALEARLRGPLQGHIRREGNRVRVRFACEKDSIDATLDEAGCPPPLAGIAPLGKGRFDYTLKWVGQRATGEIRSGRAVFPLEGANAGMDFTHGLLERETNWRWAFATGTSEGRAIAFNFSEGFLGPPGHDGCENVVWLDGAPLGVGPVHFAFDRVKPGAPWTLRTPDGGVDLRFVPEGYRAQDVDLKLILSRYVQPFGTFAGHVTDAAGTRVPLEGLAGVTEDHSARW